MKVVLVTLVGLLFIVAALAENKVVPWFGCAMHMMGYSSMDVTSEEHVMQDITQGGHSYYLFQNNTNKGTVYYVNCDYRKDGKCLHITREGKKCEEEYIYDQPTMESLVFYYDSNMSTKCPLPTQYDCTEYCNSTYSTCVVIDSKNREVLLDMSILTVAIEYFDDSFSPNIFANQFCDGTPIKPPTDFCSKHKH